MTDRNVRRPCEGCGELSPEGEYDVAIHDCPLDGGSGGWELITITPKGWAEVAALREEKGE